MKQRPFLRLVVAYSRNRVIGARGRMPWHLPSDLAHFKRTTMGRPIIMGRKTWESLGRALPGRLNLVISRQAGLSAEGAQVCADLDTALHACLEAGHEKADIIGGEQIYRLALALANEIVATEIHADIDGDAWFPDVTPAQWQEVERLPQPEENGLAFDFVTYRRIRA